jgi:hypothetical protein
MKPLLLITLLTQAIALTAFAGVAQIDNIKIASTVPADQTARFIKDIQLLKGMNFTNPDSQMLTLMGIGDAQGSTLASWMEARVNFIVDENFKLDDTDLSIDKRAFTFPNNGSPTLETPTKTPVAGGNIQTVMLNISGEIYYGGKENQQLLDVQLPGIGTEAATGMRIGILQIGSGMFMPLQQADAGKDPSTFEDGMPYVAFRLSTLIHEARHSDGNGPSIAFFHAVCSTGPYTGYAACDRNLNGPYEIQTAFLNSLVQSCTTCSAGDKIAIQNLASDDASREIVGSPDPSQDHSEMIGALQGELSYCQIIASLPAGTIPADPSSSINCNDTAAIQAQITALQNGGQNMIPSTMWDATPEGTFSAN